MLPPQILRARCHKCVKFMDRRPSRPHQTLLEWNGRSRYTAVGVDRNDSSKGLGSRLALRLSLVLVALAWVDFHRRTPKAAWQLDDRGEKGERRGTPTSDDRPFFGRRLRQTTLRNPRPQATDAGRLHARLASCFFSFSVRPRGPQPQTGLVLYCLVAAQ